MDQIHLPDPVLHDIRELQQENIQLHKQLEDMVEYMKCLEKKERKTQQMKIYNTMSKRKEEFVPLEEGKVKCMYAVLQFTILFI